MKTQPSNPHHRRSIRLPGYDYSQPGAYFITICVQDRVCLFGEVVEDKMCLNDLAEIVIEEWKKTQEMRPRIQIDAFVVMPNHFHGILIIDDGRGTLQRALQPHTCPYSKPAPTTPQPCPYNPTTCPYNPTTCPYSEPCPYG